MSPGRRSYQDNSVIVLSSGSLKWHVMIVRWQKDDGATDIQNNYQPWHHPPPPSSSVFYPSHSSYLKTASARKDKVKLTSFLRVYLHVFNLYTNGIWVFLGLTLTDNVSPRIFLVFKFQDVKRTIGARKNAVVSWRLYLAWPSPRKHVWNWEGSGKSGENSIQTLMTWVHH